MGKTELITKYDLRDDVYFINRGMIHKGKICKVTAERTSSFAGGDWTIFYDMQINESNGVWNIPEPSVFKERAEAYNKLHNR